jgi:hypothetical protein
MELTIVELESGAEHPMPLPLDANTLVRVPVFEGRDLLIVAAQHRTW